MKTDFDIAIVGSGFGGALLSQVARRLGLSVALLERGTHPRFAIGESTSPLMNLLIEELANRYDLPRLLPLTTWGAWKRTYPDVACGLKRGFTYFHHEADTPYQPDPERRNQLMVAASPHNELADTHWLRADVDHFLVREAVALGIEYADRVCLTACDLTGTGATLTGTQNGQPLHLSARFVVDATGPRGFLSRALPLPESAFDGYPPTQTLYSHFVNVRRCKEMDAFQPARNEQNGAQPPYPMDAAALHHVFDGGWMWVLRFDNGVTSAGVAAQDGLAEALGLSEGEPAWPRFLQRFPTVAEQFAEAEAVQPFVYAPRMPYRCSTAAGEGWLLLPSAAGFVDPLFSTGMPLTLLGIQRLGRILEEAWGTEGLNDRLQKLGRITLEELDFTADFIGGCYAAMPTFPLFTAYSMFYFAAAGYSEMTRRLGEPRVRRYLAADHRQFAPAMRSYGVWLKNHARSADPSDIAEITHRICQAIDPLNVAGLCDPSKQNWYGVDLEDVIRDAAKLGFTSDAMRQILADAPWAQPPD